MSSQGNNTQTDLFFIPFAETKSGAVAQYRATLNREQNNWSERQGRDFLLIDLGLISGTWVGTRARRGGLWWSETGIRWVF